MAKKNQKKPLVAIVIVNWNGDQTVLNCMESLGKTEYSNYKVIFVDNGSTDGSLEKCLKIFPKMDVIKLKENKGYTVGTNVGWRYALDKYNADYICAMDSDIVTTQKNWLDLQINELEKSDKFGISCVKLLFPDGRVQFLYFERERSEYLEKDVGQYNFIRETKAIGGACIIIKRSVIEKLGYYDENFFYGPNDVDYCFRANESGFKVLYNGFAKATHVGSFSYKTSSKDFIYGHQSFGQMAFWFRHGTLKESISSVLQQFIRAFVTRKDPFKKRSFSNTFFHLSFPKRTISFIRSWSQSSKSYKKIHNDQSSKEYAKVKSDPLAILSR